MKTYKNDITIEQLILCCQQYVAMRKTGVTENLGIRQLELFSDVYAKRLINGDRRVHHVSRVKRWSLKAIKWRKKNRRVKPGTNLVVEHGTPRRKFANMVLALYKSNKLNANQMEQLVKKYWKLAVVTKDEDLKLNKVRSKNFSSPKRRWASVGIELRKLKADEYVRSLR